MKFYLATIFVLITVDLLYPMCSNYVKDDIIDDDDYFIGNTTYIATKIHNWALRGFILLTILVFFDAT